MGCLFSNVTTMILSLLSCLFYVSLVSQLSNAQSCTTEKGGSCVFPFKYKDNTYSACSTEKVKQGKSWCSTSVDETGKHLKGNWGYCSSNCLIDGDQECTEGNQCAYRDDCPQYQEFLKLPKSHPDKKIQRQKWRASICNKKEKRLCCPVETTTNTTIIPTTSSTTEPLCNTSSKCLGSYLPQSGIDQCGKNSITASKVSGGVNVKLGEFPWAALLGYKAKENYFDYACGCQKTRIITAYRCGGTLINNWYVLTAAHCHERNNKVSSVVLGEWEVGVDPDCPNGEGECLPPRQLIEVESVTIHENYTRNIRTGEVLNDIALIRLKQPAVFNKAVQPICLPLNEEQAAKDIGANNIFDGIVGRDATVIGWGANGPYYTEAMIGNEIISQKILQKVDIPIISTEECKSKLSNLTLENADTQILRTHVCAGQSGSDKDSCEGDSGGGMFVSETNGDDSISYQIGLVSFGLTRQCGIGYSGVYTRITEFIPWIKENILM